MALDGLDLEIAEAIKKVPTEAARTQMTAELEILVNRYNSPGASQEEQENAKARLTQLRRDAEIAAQVSLWSTFSMVLTGGIAIAYVIGIAVYLGGLGSPAYAEVGATRAVLVFTLIAAMLAFGGLLIVRPLFSNEDAAKLQERFRLSREIFMIFSGIFGTIIGFYFGTANATPADPPVLGVPAFVDGKVSVPLAGGRAPFESALVLVNGDRFAMQLDGHVLSYAVASGICPEAARIEVTDGERRQAGATLHCPTDGAGDTVNKTENRAGP